MIRTRKEMWTYIHKDMERNLISGGAKSWIKILLNPRLCFTLNLRNYEYWANRKFRDPITILMTIWHYFIHKYLSYKLGFTLYKNQFGPGLYIMHYGTIVVNPACRIGANCNINADVNIGMGGSIIGNDCYISPGVKIVKPVHIGNHVVIGANAVVTKDIPDDCMVVGIHAKIIKRFDHNIQQWVKV